MKKTLFNITLASIITLVAYIVLSTVWLSVLSGIKNQTLKLFLILIMTTAAFGFFLLYISKIRKSIGEEEMLCDYKEREYISVVDDFKLIFKRETQVLICIAAIVFACFVLNTFDSLVFERKVISLPTFFFAPMCLFSSLIDIPFVGYALSAALDCLSYIVFILIYRKKKYNYWMKNKV